MPIFSYWESDLCSHFMCVHSKATGLRGSECNGFWASHREVLLHFGLLQGKCGVKKAADISFPCRQMPLMCFTCLFPEELLPKEVSNSSVSCFVPFRRKLIPPVRCSPSACTDRDTHPGGINPKQSTACNLWQWA